jgi:hypothetical protein
MARAVAPAERHDRTKETPMSARTNGWRLDPAEHARRVEAGRVVCPRRGMVDIEECWICRDYRGLSEGTVESVICAVTVETLASAVWALDHGQIAERDRG